MPPPEASETDPFDDDSPGALLGECGPVAAAVSGFAPRQAQQSMAEAVHRNLQAGGALIVEAGTGVGKTFAYLVPALLSGQRIIISTGTRHLQDQLFHRDLPRIQKALGVGVRTALLKGRGNYVCIHRLEQARQSVQESGRAAKLRTIQHWASITRTGDIAELAEVGEGDGVWAQATSTVDNCLGSECPEFNNCHLVKARRRAQEADLVVINHHLFFADMALKEEGFGEVLPTAEAFILDEAHQLPETAGRFFGFSVSSRQIDSLVQDCVAAQINDASDRPDLRERAEQVGQAMRELKLSLGPRERRDSWNRVAGEEPVVAATAALQTALTGLGDGLVEVVERSPDLERCASRIGPLIVRLKSFLQPDTAEYILWFETGRYGASLHATPAEVGELFSQHREHYQAGWVFTSATLSVAGRFDHFQERMGVNEADTACFDSPFEYRRNALLYLPTSMLEPNSGPFVERLVEASRPLLEITGGRAFMLFTSHRALREAGALLEGVIDYPLFIQGQAPRSQLLDRFRVSGNGVLLGTSSFWEGVDIRGEALSCVIIDKLPFAAPNDPVLQARLELIRRRGGNPFAEYQLPQAVIALKQGVGRLIRDVSDRGVLMIADPRLRTRGYGKTFLQSLPDMPVTDSIDEVNDFFIRANHGDTEFTEK